MSIVGSDNLRIMSDWAYYLARNPEVEAERFSNTWANGMINILDIGADTINAMVPLPDGLISGRDGLSTDVLVTANRNGMLAVRLAEAVGPRPADPYSLSLLDHANYALPFGICGEVLVRYYPNTNNVCGRFDQRADFVYELDEKDEPGLKLLRQLGGHIATLISHTDNEYMDRNTYSATDLTRISELIKAA
jgi:hypothetical protein